MVFPLNAEFNPQDWTRKVIEGTRDVVLDAAALAGEGHCQSQNDGPDGGEAQGRAVEPEADKVAQCLVHGKGVGIEEACIGVDLRIVQSIVCLSFTPVQPFE